MRIAWLALLAVCACDEHGKGGGPGFLDASSGAPCGGFAGAQCGAAEFCDFPNNSCGATDEAGRCRPRPQTCTGDFEPTCGCDGQIHSNPCDAQAGGFDINGNGGCPLTPGSFSCGPFQCSLETQFCERDLHVASPDHAFACMTLPAGCAATRNCACLAAEACGQFCTGTGATGLLLTCPG